MKGKSFINILLALLLLLNIFSLMGCGDKEKRILDKIDNIEFISITHEKAIDFIDNIIVSGGGEKIDLDKYVLDVNRTTKFSYSNVEETFVCVGQATNKEKNGVFNFELTRINKVGGEEVLKRQRSFYRYNDIFMKICDAQETTMKDCNSLGVNIYDTLEEIEIEEVFFREEPYWRIMMREKGVVHTFTMQNLRDAIIEYKDSSSCYLNTIHGYTVFKIVLQEDLEHSSDKMVVFDNQNCIVKVVSSSLMMNGDAFLEDREVIERGSGKVVLPQDIKNEINDFIANNK